MKDYSNKTLDEMTITELFDLRMALENMPKGMDSKITFTWRGKEYDDIEDLHMDAITEYFSPTEDIMKTLVGKCLKEPFGDTVIKIVGLRDDYDSPYYKDQFDEFLYEKYEKYRDGTWHPQDYIWLQKEAVSKYRTEEERNKYKRWCHTTQTELNYASESMYMVGKDGKLFIDYDCSNDYKALIPISNKTFEKIRKEALENDGPYDPNN